MIKKIRKINRKILEVITGMFAYTIIITTFIMVWTWEKIFGEEEGEIVGWDEE